MPILTLSVCPSALWAQLTVKADTTSPCLGSYVSLTASGTSADMTSWSIDPADSGMLSSATGAQTILHVLLDEDITLHAKAGDTDAPDVTISVRYCDLRDEVVRAVLGFEQLGASGTASDQNFLFDFFITRPTFNNHLRWWGDVKVASFPQQENTELVTFGQQFATTFGNLKVNQLAESAEFVTGPEFVITPIPRKFEVSLFAGGGASGPNNPTDNVTVFAVPGANTAQSAAFASFVKQFTPSVPTSPYVAFLPESTDRFLRQWQAGVRLYTFYNHAQNGLGGLPATVEFSIGQNEFVTGGHLSGLVGHVAATHPFTFQTSAGKSVTIYLFGEATTAYVKRSYSTPLPLAPAVDSSGTPISITNSGVTTITVPPNRRDTYRIGVGVDLISVLTSLWGTSSAK